MFTCPHVYKSGRRFLINIMCSLHVADVQVAGISWHCAYTYTCITNDKGIVMEATI